MIRILHELNESETPLIGRAVKNGIEIIKRIKASVKLAIREKMTREKNKKYLISKGRMSNIIKITISNSNEKNVVIELKYFFIRI